MEFDSPNIKFVWEKTGRNEDFGFTFTSAPQSSKNTFSKGLKKYKFELLFLMDVQIQPEASRTLPRHFVLGLIGIKI